jgi:hypothetical protein
VTFQEAKQELSRKLDIDYSDIANNGLLSDTDLGSWINLGVIDAWDYRPWPFTQGTETATLDSNPKSDYVDHPQDLMNGSIYLLRVGGKEYRKVLMEDYLKYLEDFPTATDRIWSEQETFLFINKNAYSINDTFDLYGKKMAPQLSGASDILPFSPITDNQEHSGNNAIVLLAQAWALESEKKNKPDVAVGVRTQALGILKSLWKPYAQSRAYLQSKGRPMFDLPDLLSDGPTTGRQSNPSNIGNFTYLN